MSALPVTSSAANDPQVLQLASSRFVRVDLFCRLTGYTDSAVRTKLSRGEWLEGRQYVRRDGCVLMDMEGYVPPVPEPTPEARALKLAALKGFHRAKRRASELQRTPHWADLRAIRAFYAEAQRLTRETGIPHHVDHEVPLQGDLVCGLHVHTNLQIITGSENMRKRNRFKESW